MAQRLLSRWPNWASRPLPRILPLNSLPTELRQRRGNPHPRHGGNLVTDRFARFGGRTRLFVALLALSLVLLLFAGLAYTRSLDDRPKAALALMTTLPLQWSEGGIEADLAQDAAPHPALARLTQRYDIDPIDDLTT
jgi:hypothetical protein